MNIAAIQFPVFNPYNASTLEIYVSGCNRTTCSDGACHNAEIRSFSFGNKLNTSELLKYIDERRDMVECISITGGDLLCQPYEEALELVEGIYLMFRDKDLWLFTGENDFNKIPDFCTHYFDVIKYGGYREELKQNAFPASKNQKIWRNPNK
jgi:organic radical activating enzyme